MIAAQSWHKAIQWMSDYHRLSYPSQQLFTGLPISKAGELDQALFIRALENIHLQLNESRLSLQSLSLLPLLFIKDDNLYVLTGKQAQQLEVVDLASGDNITMTLEQVEACCCFHISPSKQTDVRADEHFTDNKHWLRVAVEQVKPWYRDLLLASLVVNLLALIVPLFTMNVYDRVVPNAAFHTLWVLASGVFIVVVFDWLLRQARTTIGDMAGKEIDQKVSANIFAKMMGMKLEHRPQSAAAFSKQIQEFDSVREFFTSATLVSAIDLPFTLLFLLLIGYLGGYMVLIPLSIMLLLLLLAFYLKKPINNAVDEVSKFSTQRQAHLLENLNLLNQVKHHNGEARAQSQWERLVANMSDWQMRSKALTSLMSHSVMSLQQLTTILLVISGVYLIFAGELSMGGLIAIVMLSGRAANSINQLAMLLLRYQQCKSAISSIETVMALPQEVNSAARVNEPFHGKIDAQHVDFNYPEAETTTLRDINLQIKPGKKYALIGAAGSGKSTLLALLARQFECSKGSLLYDDVEANIWSTHKLRQAIGFLPQMPLLHFGSIIENIVFGLPELDKEQLATAIAASGMGLFIKNLPQGLETQVGEFGRQLSGGQRQAVLLARTLMSKPSLLILDEPTSAMDQTMKKQVLKTLHDSDKTLLIASHDPELVQLCDEVWLMEKGRIISRKPVEKAATVAKTEQSEKKPQRIAKVQLKNKTVTRVKTNDANLVADAANETESKDNG